MYLQTDITLKSWGTTCHLLHISLLSSCFPLLTSSFYPILSLPFCDARLHVHLSSFLLTTLSPHSPSCHFALTFSLLTLTPRVTRSILLL
ncbi:hypothetical protein F5H01DRAFT_347913 [Linnemannia elongata]|nr:hypothetical protein F5H01DRAFT_347913 [Linnemannia elongata]